MRPLAALLLLLAGGLLATGAAATERARTRGLADAGSGGDPVVLTVRLLPLLSARVGGLAALVSDSSGNVPRHVLIDGGDDESTVLHRLRGFGIAQVALVVLTHPHADHYVGLTGVMRELPVGAFAWSGDTRTLASFQRLLVAVDSSSAVPVIVDRGPRTITLATGGDSLRIVLLPPAPHAVGRGGDAINNRSVGVRIERGTFSVLVPGDAERQQTEWWSRHFPELLAVDVLVSSHHGADNANPTLRWPRWYTTVTPRALLVSANGRQHPYANVLDFATRGDIATYCTHTHGDVVVRVTRQGAWRIETEREVPCTPGTRAPR